MKDELDKTMGVEKSNGTMLATEHQTVRDKIKYKKRIL